MDDNLVTDNKKFLHVVFKKCSKLKQFNEIKKSDFKLKDRISGFS